MTGSVVARPAASTKRAARSLGGRFYKPGLLLVPGVAFMTLVYFVPIVGLLLTSFGRGGWTVAHYQEVFADLNLWHILWNTLVLAAKVTAVCTLIAYPLAYVTLRMTPRM